MSILTNLVYCCGEFNRIEVLRFVRMVSYR